MQCLANGCSRLSYPIVDNKDLFLTARDANHGCCCNFGLKEEASFWVSRSRVDEIQCNPLSFSRTSLCLRCNCFESFINSTCGCKGVCGSMLPHIELSSFDRSVSDSHLC
uniref:Uncharacterized protein n=1 Tax=Physcomitrium patens TaxID=3218 RepID=A0A2K1I9X3_PHYPA|nr:hypothetical protein PHYPA_031161 [Physcomitrium patens]